MSRAAPSRRAGVLALAVLLGLGGCAGVSAPRQSPVALDCEQSAGQLAMARSHSGRDVVEDLRAELLARCLDARSQAGRRADGPIGGYAQDQAGEQASDQTGDPAEARPDTRARGRANGRVDGRAGERAGGSAENPDGRRSDTPQASRDAAWPGPRLVDGGVRLPDGAALPLPPEFIPTDADTPRGRLGPTRFAVLELAGPDGASLSLAVQERTDAPLLSGFTHGPHPLPPDHALFERGTLEAGGLHASWCASFTRPDRAAAGPAGATGHAATARSAGFAWSAGFDRPAEHGDPEKPDGPSAPRRPEAPGGPRGLGGSAEAAESGGIMAFGATLVLSRESRLVLAVTAPMPPAAGPPPAGLLLDDTRFAALDGLAAAWKHRLRGWLRLLARSGGA